MGLLSHRALPSLVQNVQPHEKAEDLDCDDCVTSTLFGMSKPKVEGYARNVTSDPPKNFGKGGCHMTIEARLRDW